MPSTFVGPETWVHLSDLHFGTETRAVCDALAELVAARRPSGVIVSGDVTQRAKRGEFRKASEFLRRIAGEARLLVVPGNHDLPLFRVLERAFFPYRNFQASFSPVRSVELASEGIFRFLLVNTTRPRRHKLGTLNPEQVEEVERTLRQCPEGAIRVVVLHHPLPAFSDTGAELSGDFADGAQARAVVQRWTRAGLDLVLCGHTHRPRVLRLTPPAELRGASAPESAQLSRTPWLLQAGTGLSQRLRNESNSVFLLTGRAPEGLAVRPTILLERLDYSESSERFEKMSEVLLN